MDENNFRVETISGVSTLGVDSDRIEECLRYYREKGIDRLSINAFRGYTLLDLNFFRAHNYVQNVTIVPPSTPHFDWSGLGALKNLRSLTLNGDAPVSLAQFPDLREFRGSWGASLELSTCRRLEKVALWHYKAKSSDLGALPDLPALHELSLVESTISTLHGLARFPGLRKLELAYLTKLRSVADVAQLVDLEEFDADVCKKIQDHDAVRVLKKLRVLRYNDCGELPTLHFIDGMTALEELRFVGTNILDGDLRPILRLKRVGFSQKKHYSHTRAQVDEILQGHRHGPSS